MNTPPLDLDQIHDQIRHYTPFSRLTETQRRHLLAEVELVDLEEGESLAHDAETQRNYLVIFHGALSVHRAWKDAEGRERVHASELETEEGHLAFLSTVPLAARVVARKATRLLRLNGGHLDEMLMWQASPTRTGTDLPGQLKTLRNSDVFGHLPFANVLHALERMTRRDVTAGETVVTQGEKGEEYYYIEEGHAEVWRTDAMSDETACVAVLGPGDTFGEEALIMGGFRTATVTMVTDGRLGVLDKETFDCDVKGALAEEIGAAAARALVASGGASWLDCRYDMEYEEVHIPGARWMPLDTLREQADELDPKGTYVVYCRSGRRSLCAAFLLRQLGIHAVSMVGGMREWRYEVEVGGGA